jgi:hypothetical protein
MSRTLLSVVGGLVIGAVVLALFAGAIGGFFRPSMASAQAASATATPSSSTSSTSSCSGHHRMMGGMYHVPSDLSFLCSENAIQRFDSFRGGTLSWVNPSGTTVTLTMVPGTVSSVNSSSIALTPNGSSTSSTYTINSSTIVRGTPPPGSIQAINPGERVIVFTTGTGTSSSASSGGTAAMIVAPPWVNASSSTGAAGTATATPTSAGAAVTPTATP